MPNMTHPAATTEDDWNNMKDAEEWDALRDEIDYHKADARKWANALDRANAELAKAAIQIADLCEEKEYAIRMCGIWREDSEKLEALTIQLVKAQQQNNQREWVAVIDALRKYGEAAMEWNEGDAPKVGAGTTATEGHNAELRGGPAASSPERPA